MLVRDELKNPIWAEDEDLGHGPLRELCKGETEFFQGLIKKYLYPLIKDKVREEKVKQQLKELKNQMSSAFLLVNAVFVVAISALQLNTNSLYIKWPLPDAHGNEIKLEPVGIVFLGTFGLIMLLQVSTLHVL